MAQRLFVDSVLTTRTIAALNMNELNEIDYLFLVFCVVSLLKDPMN